MLLLTIIYAGLIVAAVRFGDLPAGRALYSALIAAPASWLTRIPPRRAAIILVLLLCAFLAWNEIGPLLMAADYAPLLWIADMSLYLDVLLMAAAATAVVRMKSIGYLTSGLLRGALGARPARRLTRGRSPRPRRPKRPPPADEGAPDFSICVAA